MTCSKVLCSAGEYLNRLFKRHPIGALLTGVVLLPTLMLLFVGLAAAAAVTPFALALGWL